MARIIALILTGLLAGLGCAPAQAAEPRVVSHEVSLSIDPPAHRLEGQDKLTLAEGSSGELRLLLHQGLGITRAVSAEGGAVRLSGPKEAPAGLKGWVVELPKQAMSLTIDYSGTIFEPPSRGARHGLETETGGLISPEGLFLPQAADFHPWQPGQRASLRVTVETPEGYEAVSAGKMAGRKVEAGRTRVVWESDGGRSFLLGGPLVLRQEVAAGVPLYLYFYAQDADLAPAYAAKLKEVLPPYISLLGFFPYPKFAVVENFFPTGYGFPSVTLLGKQVVRLPFVLEGSLAHELVHSWLGCSVEPDGGDWAEGLTAYMSDYLLVERRSRSEGLAERRRMLERFSLYAPRIHQPLAAFQEPGDRLSDALGYTKGALVFHQLRTMLWDQGFFDGLRMLIQRFGGSKASWDDLRTCFELASDQDLGWFFRQWVNGSATPRLTISQGQVEKTEKGWRTTAVLGQEVPGGAQPFRLSVPLVLEVENGPSLTKRVELSWTSAKVEFESAERPRRLVVDPEAQVLRQLWDYELPANLHRLFAAEERVYALPEGAQALAARQAAETLSLAEPGRITAAKELKADGLPQAVVFFGELPERFAHLVPAAPKPSGDGFTFQGRSYPKEAAVAVVAAAPGGRVVCLVYGRTPEGLATAARLLPHLGRYGWAVFEPGKRPVEGDPEPAGWLSLDLGP